MVHSLTIGLPVNVVPFTLHRHYPEKIPHIRPCATLSDSRPSLSGPEKIGTVPKIRDKIKSVPPFCLILSRSEFQRSGGKNRTRRKTSIKKGE